MPPPKKGSYCWPWQWNDNKENLQQRGRHKHILYKSKLQFCNILTKTLQLLTSVNDSVDTLINLSESLRFLALFLSFSFFLSSPRSPLSLQHFFCDMRNRPRHGANLKPIVGQRRPLLARWKAHSSHFFFLSSFFSYWIVSPPLFNRGTSLLPPLHQNPPPTRTPHYPHPNPETIGGDETPLLPFFAVRSGWAILRRWMVCVCACVSVWTCFCFFFGCVFGSGWRWGLGGSWWPQLLSNMWA